MAEARLDFNEESLDKSGDLYLLYDRLYQGMVKANDVEAPAFPQSVDFIVLDGNGLPSFDADGNPIIDTAKIEATERMAVDYSTILMKNSAYMFANSILSVMSGGGSGAVQSTGYVSRAGDSMKGSLQAWYGFEAGVCGNKILEVTIDAEEKKWAIISDNLRTKGNAEIQGLLDVTGGISFDNVKAIYIDNDVLTIKRQNTVIEGSLSITGNTQIGDVEISKNGIYFDGNEYYNAGNSNSSLVDWTMKDSHVYGNLRVDCQSSFNGKLIANQGFVLGLSGSPLLLSDEERGSIILTADLQITQGAGVKFDEDYVLNVRSEEVVSLSAPGRTLNLGDSDGEKTTNKISLQSDVWDYSNNFKLISKEGTGYFPNGLCAASAVNGNAVIETYRKDSTDMGVVFGGKLRLGYSDGPAMFCGASKDTIITQLSYVNGQVSGNPTETLKYSTYFAQTTSPFRNLSKPWSASLHLNTEGEFFVFDKPIESECISIKSEHYHTRLIEDALFFDDGKFIEGVADGLRLAGNSYFDNSISSSSFASGFAGYGWAVKEETTNGGFHATFDTLTVRKKMRIYELEVQKISCTNGSIWVSDSCSGDEVIRIN